jgi:hypothetical protein
MGMGGFGAVGDLLFGSVSMNKTSGIFDGAQDLGGAFSDSLMERLTTPTEDTRSFNLGSAAIRDRLGGVAATQRAQLGQSANAGGFLDSGSVSEGLGAIDRAEMSSFGDSLTSLYLQLEENKFNNVMPFLGAASDEATQLKLGNQSAETAARGQNADFVGGTIGSFTSMI